MSLLSEIIRIARQAGERILVCYAGAPQFALKDDRSPLTEADQASHEFICGELQRLTPEIPIVSEESPNLEQISIEAQRQFWLVDPLDGTKEFLKKTGQFTVNIALIEAQQPILGVVHAPALQATYWAERGQGAWRHENGCEPRCLSSRKPNPARMSIVASKDHSGPLVKELVARFPGAELVSMGSSLKFCLVAAGEADLYLRDGPTMEWDTAAAHCVVEQAGGSVKLLDGAPLRYAKPGFRNPAILTSGSEGLPHDEPA